MTRYCYGKDPGVKGVGYYTDNKPGLVPYKGVDQNGNPPGAFARGRGGPDNEPMTAPLAPVVQGSRAGFSGKLPRK